MSDVTFWHDFETDQWTVRDGERTETISPFPREAFIDYHQHEMQNMKAENDDLIDEAAAIREQNDRLRKENDRLRELVRGFLCEHADYIAEGNYFIGDLDLEHAMHHNQAYFRREAKKLGIEVDE